MASAEPTVFIVDDDDAIRDSLGMLLDSVGKPHKAFASGDDLLSQFDASRSRRSSS